MSDPIGIVITVHRGECEVVHDDRLLSLKLIGRQAHRGQELVVGDEVRFDPEGLVVLDVEPRRTRLARRRPRARHREQVIAANIDQLAIVASVDEPPFRSGAVDRFMLAALAGGLRPLLVVNKLDLLETPDLPDAIAGYADVLPLHGVCAHSGAGLEGLRESLAGARTVLAGHSGVGKSSLLNALKPELRLETGDVARHGRGRHTTTRSVWMRLGPDTVVIDTPGVREIATGPVELELLDRVYPDIAERAGECRFRDCAHDREPGCAVGDAIESGTLRQARLEGYRRLLADP